MSEGQMKKKLMVFIDNSNLFKGLETKDRGFRIDFKKLVDHIANMKNDRMLVKSNIYIGIIHGLDNQKQEGFFKSLRKLGFNVTLLGGKKIGEKFFEKGLDTALTMDMLEMGLKGMYDVAALIAGDGDYTNLVKRVKNGDKEVEVYFYNNYTSNKLIDAADNFFPLDDVLDNFRLERNFKNEEREEDSFSTKDDG